MGYAISLWAPPALPIAGSSESFPVRRIFCVGRNYTEHQKEMGGDGREQPFFFLKSAHSLVPGGGLVHYPAKTSNYHYETEMVVAIAKGGRRIDARKANDHIFFVFFKHDCPFGANGCKEKKKSALRCLLVTR